MSARTSDAWRWWLACALLAAPLLAGCKSGEVGATGPYATPEAGRRDTAAAEELTRRASALAEVDPEETERLLRAALTADIFHGPAHNNLGVLYLRQGKLYEAAQEFEWARKLMPGHPDPRVNLALALEGAGRSDEAMEAYHAALQVYPGHLPAMMGAASLALRTRIKDERLQEWLEEIALRAESPVWRQWALVRLTALAD